MQAGIRTALHWWTGELARAFAPARRKTPPWRGMLLQRQEGLDVFVRQGRSVQHAGRIEPAADGDEARRIGAMLRAKGATGDALVLRLGPDDVIATELTLPAAVRDVLAPVVRNKVEVVSPWPASQCLFAYEPQPAAPGDTQIKVAVWVAGKAPIEQRLATLADAGIVPGIVDAGDDTETEPRFNLVGRGGDDPAKARRTVGRLLAAGALAVAAAGGGLAVYGIMLERELGALDESIQRLAQAQAAASRPRDAEARRRWLQVIDQRRSVPSIAISIELLSRALPDDAYLERLEVRNGLVTLTGKAQTSAGLIGQLEAVHHFEQVQFAAPTTRQAGAEREDFSLALRVKPILMLDGARQP